MDGAWVFAECPGCGWAGTGLGLVFSNNTFTIKGVGDGRIDRVDTPGVDTSGVYGGVVVGGASGPCSKIVFENGSHPNQTMWCKGNTYPC